jgi:hypothetical protein
MSVPSPTVVTAKPVLPSEAPPRPFQFRLWHLLAMMLLVGIALAVTVPAYRAFRRAGQRMESANNLHQIGIALHNYHDVWNTFPPAHLCDASGKPVHSWRVLISPFVQKSSFYDRYNFAEPWNGPNNRQLENMLRWCWRAPGDPKNSVLTSYVAIVGPGTPWPDSQSTNLTNISDGTSNTVLIVEISHSDIHWMEPRDLPIEELEAWLDPKHKPRLGGEIEGGLVVYADGSVHFIPRTATIKEWRALLTPAGNDLTEVRPDKY